MGEVKGCCGDINCWSCFWGCEVDGDVERCWWGIWDLWCMEGLFISGLYEGGVKGGFFCVEDDNYGWLVVCKFCCVVLLDWIFRRVNRWRFYKVICFRKFCCKKRVCK